MDNVNVINNVDSMDNLDNKDSTYNIYNTDSNDAVDIHINNKLWNYLNSDSMKYSRIEAFCYLVQQIQKSESKRFAISVNKLAKQWKWDNHTADDFLEEMKQSNVFSIEHGSKGIVISLTTDFCKMQDSFPELFDLISSEERKTTKMEAVLYLLQHRNDSYRRIASTIGWNHHSVISLAKLIQTNGEFKSSFSLRTINSDILGK